MTTHEAHDAATLAQAAPEPKRSKPNPGQLDIRAFFK